MSLTNNKNEIVPQHCISIEYHDNMTTYLANYFVIARLVCFVSLTPKILTLPNWCFVLCRFCSYMCAANLPSYERKGLLILQLGHYKEYTPNPKKM